MILHSFVYLGQARHAAPRRAVTVRPCYLWDFCGQYASHPRLLLCFFMAYAPVVYTSFGPQDVLALILTLLHQLFLSNLYQE